MKICSLYGAGFYYIPGTDTCLKVGGYVRAEVNVNAGGSFGVVGRPAGSVPGFNYTADHKKLGIAWDVATLDKYLTNPRAMVPDTSMVYAGLKDDTERADLVAYLETLH